MTAESSPISPYESRLDYHQSPEDKLIECSILADTLDELMIAPVNTSSDIESTACSDEQGTYVSRSFRYIEGDSTYGWAWPLVEKAIDISYQRSPNGLTSETYLVRIDTTIHQQNLDQSSIPNFYELTFFGSDRSSVIATIETPNLTEANEADFVTRTTTPYDHNQLSDELLAFERLLHAEARENGNIARIE